MKKITLKKIMGLVMFACFAFLCNQVFAYFGDPNIAMAMAVGAITQDYYNNYISPLDIQARYVLPNLQPRHGRQGIEFLKMLMALGMVRTSAIEITEHYEDEWIWNNFTALSQSATGGGSYTPAANTPCIIRLAAVSVDSNNKYFPQISHVVNFPGDIAGVIYNIVASGANIDLYINPLTAAKIIPAVSNGDQLMIASSIHSESSGQPASLFNAIYKWSNTSQVVKSTKTISGKELTIESWIKTVDGKGIEGWSGKGLLDLEYEQLTKLQGLFFMGEKVDSTGAVDGLNANATLVGQGSRGLFQEMTDNSIPYPYAPGTWQIADYYQMAKFMKREYQSDNIGLFMGLDLNNEADMQLFELNKDTAVVYAERAKNALFGGSGDVAKMDMTIGFKYINVSGTTFCIKGLDAFYNPKTYGTTGYDYNSRGIVIPLRFSKDPVSSQSIPQIGQVYRSQGKYNRRAHTWETGAWASSPNSKTDVLEVNTLTEVTNEFFASTNFIDIRPV